MALGTHHLEKTAALAESTAVPQQQMRLYLVKGTLDPSAVGALNLADIPLEGKPLFTSDDVVYYDVTYRVVVHLRIADPRVAGKAVDGAAHRQNGRGIEPVGV